MNTKYNGDILSHNARVVKAGGVVESLDYTNFISEESKQISFDFFRTYNNPAFCYSLRRLNTAYKGPAISVRRSSDNAQVDINYTLNRELDTQTLLDFVGSGNSGFVVTWYDQSGNGKHLVSGNTASPTIVSAGTLVTVNGKPALDFDGVNNFMYRTVVPGITFSQNHSVFSVFRLKTNPTNSRFIFQTTVDTNNRVAISIQAQNICVYQNINAVINVKSAAFQNNVSYLAYIDYDPLQLYLNNVNATGTISTGGYASPTIVIGSARNWSVNTATAMYFQEIFMFQHKSTVEQTAIQNNINSYYNIY